MQAAEEELPSTVPLSCEPVSKPTSQPGKLCPPVPNSKSAAEPFSDWTWALTAADVIGPKREGSYCCCSAKWT